MILLIALLVFDGWSLFWFFSFLLFTFWLRFGGFRRINIMILEVIIFYDVTFMFVLLTKKGFLFYCVSLYFFVYPGRGHPITMKRCLWLRKWDMVCVWWDSSLVSKSQSTARVSMSFFSFFSLYWYFPIHYVLVYNLLVLLWIHYLLLLVLYILLNVLVLPSPYISKLPCTILLFTSTYCVPYNYSEWYDIQNHSCHYEHCFSLVQADVILYGNFHLLMCLSQFWIGGA